MLFSVSPILWSSSYSNKWLYYSFSTHILSLSRSCLRCLTRVASVALSRQSANGTGNSHYCPGPRDGIHTGKEGRGGVINKPCGDEGVYNDGAEAHEVQPIRLVDLLVIFATLRWSFAHCLRILFARWPCDIFCLLALSPFLPALSWPAFSSSGWRGWWSLDPYHWP